MSRAFAGLMARNRPAARQRSGAAGLGRGGAGEPTVQQPRGRPEGGREAGREGERGGSRRTLLPSRSSEMCASAGARS